jgi:hypothetical protein
MRPSVPMMNTPGSCRTSPMGIPTVWPLVMAKIPLTATEGESSPNADSIFSPKVRYNRRFGSEIRGKGISNFISNAADSSGVPIPTRTTCAPARSKYCFFWRNCATCCRQNAHPRCRKNMSTSGCFFHRSLRSRSAPSAIVTLASKALLMLLFIFFLLTFKYHAFRTLPALMGIEGLKR